MMGSLIHAFPRFHIPSGQILDFLFFIALVLVVDFHHFRTNDRFIVLKWNPVLRAVFYLVCFFMLSLNGASGGKDFIYFQF